MGFDENVKVLQKGDWWEAMWNRRTYATTGVRIRLDFRVNGAAMGAETDCLEANTVRADIVGTTDLSAVEILRDNAPVHVVQPDGPAVQCQWHDDRPHPGAWYYLRVTQIDGNMAWSSPVWTL